MWTGKYELVIIWADGSDTNIYVYDSREQAKLGADAHRICFGEQVEYMCIRKQYV